MDPKDLQRISKSTKSIELKTRMKINKCRVAYHLSLQKSALAIEKLNEEVEKNFAQAEDCFQKLLIYVYNEPLSGNQNDDLKQFQNCIDGVWKYLC